MGKQRIEFIDLAKGICIILVTIGHCGVNIAIPGLEIVRMPLYFMLSGLFFKTYGDFTGFAIKKTNKILIPFLFFYIAAYILYYILKYTKPEFLITDATGILDIFTQRQYFNGPIWFLLALYWCGIIFAGLTIVIKRDAVRILAILAIGWVGVLLGRVNIIIPMFIDVALTAMPFYCLGYYLKQTKILYSNKYDKYNILFAILLYAISYLISQNTTFRLAYHYNAIENIVAVYAIAITSVMAILYLCKIIKYIPIVSYMGRYSIIILCTHHMLYRPLSVIFNKFPYEFMHTTWFLAVSTLLICWALIPVCIKFIPYFVAQKDLIKWKPNAQKS